MATLNMAFDIASNALDADQSALNIVANNVANASTPGYTREVANWQENDPVTISGVSYGQGAQVTGPVSQRDSVLDQSLQQQSQNASASTARLAALDQLQSIFSQVTTANSSSSTSTTNGISQDLSAFFDSLSQLESSPADNSLRQQVLTAAGNLAGDFQAASSQVAGQQTRSISRVQAWLVRSTRSPNPLPSSTCRSNQQVPTPTQAHSKTSGSRMSPSYRS